MTTDVDLGRRVRRLLREALDRQSGPDPLWDEAPAARRIHEMERRDGRVRWPLRALGVAAVLALGGAGLLVVGALDRHRSPEPSGVTNGWIAYAVLDPASGDHDIFLVGLDRPPWRVAGKDSDDLDEICPAFSPDGRRLAYGEAQGTAASGAYRSARLVIVDLEADGNPTGARHIEVGGSHPPPCATWSPEGDRLAFGVPETSPLNPDRSATGSDVWVVSMPDERVTKLPDLLATDLAWSPDGSVLAIASGHDQISPGNALADGQIYLFDRGSGRFRALQTAAGAYSLSWAPDGHRIVYESNGLIRMIDVGTGKDALVTAGSDPVQGWDPVWAPWRDTIIVRRAADSSRESPAEAVLLELAGDPTGTTSRLFSSPADTPIADVRTGFVSPERTVWSPDGKQILYVGGWPTRGTRAIVVAPIDPRAPPLLLAEGAGISGYDAYDAVAPIVDQTWARSFR